ncbi:UDP-3-O-(3-hydroxymyristoyl)glucosamine N-acyltransferase [Pseudovibrio axinellae]|uniref:UDP-3-O-acylglucosamine N-acyltransferase n=1 Tax=Pseudovibrio axinellae TaxID=989403 RepID=A0A161VCH6_9HYPH|nr:UDP-3-O-(3-hydroxymyristoyl)glucosamine N-acyltransferase [Pseudovibrio axinellae]KZL21886.1 UDP-3-O-(3-hydroxymyristoyl)glucosamine N-acyltransferase [Pseudovibrio axinellae]SEQ82386.1 UDP-3-O-[3-hydroxymyristoyl] glucosamine N-acyltransferase [Pseudovibrio axinellae]
MTEPSNQPEVSPVFFPEAQKITIKQIAEWAGAEIVRGDGDLTISGVVPLDAGVAGTLVFIDNPKYLDQLTETHATACLVSKKHLEKVPEGVIPLLAKEPYRSLSKVLAKLYPSAMRPLPATSERGVSAAAFVEDSAVLGEGVIVEAGAVIGAGVVIGAGSVVGPNAVIASNCQLGELCSIGANSSVQHSVLGDRVIIHPNVSLGQDGFGFAMGAGGHIKVPQVGRVVIGNDVEIGAGSCVDRGANRDTIVDDGTKIDNQVQIGHNANIGKHCVIVSQVGISGSATLEDYVVMGGKSGVSGHVRVGMGAQIAGVSAVHEDLAPGGRYGGVPARPIREWFKEITMIRRLAAQGSKKKEN